MTIKKPLVVKQPTIGQLIRELCGLLGLMQEQFAAHIGVVWITVNRWENGRSNPSPIAMKLLEQKLDEVGEEGKNLLAKYFS